MLDTSKARTASLFVALAVTVVLGVQTGTGVASAQQEGAREVDEPEVAARAWALADLRSKEYLAGQAEAKKLPIGSSTKFMTALVVLEGADPGEEVTVSQNAAKGRRKEGRGDQARRREGLRGGLARAAGVVYRWGDFPIGDR